jgi:F-type H+-transporting ATPase subunit delta
MRIDRQSRQSAKKYFRACLGPNGAVDEEKVRGFVQILSEEKPRNFLAILSYPYRLVELTIEENAVRLESATPLPDRGASVFSELERRYGPASRTSYEENPALIGGLRIRRGNNIWDGSLSGRLQRLQQALS